MTTFPAYATNFEVFPKSGSAFDHLSKLIGKVRRVDFVLRVDDPTVNQGQMVSDFDQQFEKSLHQSGAKRSSLILPQNIPQEFDFVFTFREQIVVVESEKANREKILRDLLKCHMYLEAGADFAMIVLPRNYPHTHAVWNLFQFGIDRFLECRTYGFCNPAKLQRTLLVGFDQFDAETDIALSSTTRQEMRRRAVRQGGPQ